MPNVKGKKYPYTPAGMLAANRARKSSGQPISKPMTRPMARPMARPMVSPMRPMRPMVKPMGRPMRKPVENRGGARRMGTPSLGRVMTGRKKY